MRVRSFRDEITRAVLTQSEVRMPEILSNVGAADARAMQDLGYPMQFANRPISRESVEHSMQSFYIDGIAQATRQTLYAITLPPLGFLGTACRQLVPGAIMRPVSWLYCTPDLEGLLDLSRKARCGPRLVYEIDACSARAEPHPHHGSSLHVLTACAVMRVRTVQTDRFGELPYVKLEELSPIQIAALKEVPHAREIARLTPVSIFSQRR